MEYGDGLSSVVSDSQRNDFELSLDELPVGQVI